jgi:hypothetical protein
MLYTSSVALFLLCLLIAVMHPAAILSIGVVGAEAILKILNATQLSADLLGRMSLLPQALVQ